MKYTKNKKITIDMCISLHCIKLRYISHFKNSNDTFPFSLTKNLHLQKQSKKYTISLSLFYIDYKSYQL